MSVFSPIQLKAATVEQEFSAAMNHVKNEEWPQARNLLEQVLQNKRDLHRARVELALVYIRLGQKNLAKNQLKQVLDTDGLPPNVVANIRRIYQQLLEECLQQPETVNTEHIFNGYASFAMGADSNVRFSSGDYFLEDDPLLDGIFIELESGDFAYISPDGYVYDIEGNQLFENNERYDLGSPNNDTYFTEASFGLGHKVNLESIPTLTWHNKVNVKSTYNKDFNEYDKLKANFNTSLQWHFNEQDSIQSSFDYKLLKRDGQVHVQNGGIGFVFSHFGQLGSWEVGAHWLKRKYHDTSVERGDIITEYIGFDSITRSASLKWSNLFFDNKLLLFSQIESSENKANDYSHYRGLKLSIASVYSFTSDLKLSITASKLALKYSRLNGFDDNLKDQSNIIKAKLTYRINDELELFLNGHKASRKSEVYGEIKREKSILKVGFTYKF
ncbi:MAG: hypothetical protein P8I03_16095 [Thalassotalea sp.]|nr:hypothetical protein [Thalassotalea sp.]